MEKKEISTITTMSSVSSGTKILGISGSEMVQMPLSAIPEATPETTGFMSGKDKENLDRLPYLNFYGNPNGLLLKTDIAESANAMCSLSIRGMAYAHDLPHDSVFQFYNLPSDNVFYRASGICNGAYMEINVFLHDGVICLWIDPKHTTHGLDLCLFSVIHGSVGAVLKSYNRIVSATNAPMPTGVKRLKLIEPQINSGTHKGFVSDANLATETGEYVFQTVTVNTPASDYYLVSVKRAMVYIVQRLYRLNANYSYTRISTDGGKTWKKYVQDAQGTVMGV